MKDKKQITLGLDNFFDHDWVNKEDAATDGVVQWAMANPKLKDLSKYENLPPEGTGFGCPCYDEPNEYKYVYEIPVYGEPEEVKQELAQNPEFKELLKVEKLVELIDEEHFYHPTQVVYCGQCKQWTIYYGA